jgi:hypothetical protein
VAPEELLTFIITAFGPEGRARTGPAEENRPFEFPKRGSLKLEPHRNTANAPYRCFCWKSPSWR